MRVVMAAAEAVPFAKTGGLADVIGALPQALARLPDTQVSVFLPYHRVIRENPSVHTQFLLSFPVDLAWRRQAVGLFLWKGSTDACRIYFLDNRQYFDRNTLYGEIDDGERYAFFSKSVLEALVKMAYQPDVIQCHDWHTALIPVFLQGFYRGCFPSVKTIFTIHNILFQGWADSYFCADVLGLPESYTALLRHKGAINFMKGAIVSADKVTTVSPTYAQEIRYAYFGEGLSELLCRYGHKLSGILNGIDEELWNPSRDIRIFSPFTPENLEGKRENKRRLQQRLQLPQKEHTPVLAMITRLTEQKGIDLLQWILPGLLQEDVQLIVLGTGESRYERYFAQMQHLYPEKLSANLFFGGDLANQIYAGADCFLMPSRTEPCGIAQMIAMRYGTVPIVHETGGLKDTVPAYNICTEEGSGFTFQSYNADDFLDAVKRALTCYWESPEQWHRLVKQNMTRSFGWEDSAQAYKKLMEDLCQNHER